MYERTYGPRYEEVRGHGSTQIAVLIRAEIKKAISEGRLPEHWSYSVRSDSLSIDIKVKDCADAWMPCPGYRVGSRHELPGGGWAATGCSNAWCKAGGEHKDSPHATEHEVLTEQAMLAKATLQQIHDAFNYNGSEVQADYFDVNYYGTVSFEDQRSARFEAQEKARKQARRQALDTAGDLVHLKVYRRAGQTVHLAGLVEGTPRPVCGADIRRSSLTATTDDPVTCSRCVKRQQQTR